MVRVSETAGGSPGMDDTGIDRIAAAIERLATMVTVLTYAVSFGTFGIVIALSALRGACHG
jgi:hypothetical protein